MYLKVGSPRLIDAAWNYFNLDAIKGNTEKGIDILMQNLREATVVSWPT